MVMPRLIDDINEWYIMPLGVMYVSSSVKAAGIQLYTLNLNHEEGTIENVLKKYIETNNIDVVLTGGTSPQYFAIHEILKAAKKCNNNIITIVGGGIITSTPVPAMIALKYADYGIVGEGEVTTCQLIRALESGIELCDIKGIVYCEKNRFVVTEAREEIEDIDKLPFPDYDGFGVDIMSKKIANFEVFNTDHTIVMSASRSCPFQCTFCFKATGKKYRQLSLDRFFSQLDYLVKKHQIKSILLTDELFSYNLERVRAFCERIKQYDLSWAADFRVCDITPEMVEILKKGNCSCVLLGLESFDNRILKSMNKGIAAEQIAYGLSLLHEAGIAINGNFIFGDVEETVETATVTLNWWKEHQEYGIHLGFITPYPGTVLYEKAIQKKIIRDEVQYIKDGCPMVNLSKMSNLEVEWLVKEIASAQNVQETLDYYDVELLSGGRISFSGKCKKCNTINRWENTKLFMKEIKVPCKACKQGYMPPLPYQAINNIKINIEKLLETYTKIAFWGMNQYFLKIIEFMPMEICEKLYFIDLSKVKQGTVIQRRVVSSPGVLRDEKIECVIIAVVYLFGTIKIQIESEYPNVKRIINLSELIN